MIETKALDEIHGGVVITAYDSESGTPGFES